MAHFSQDYYGILREREEEKLRQRQYEINQNSKIYIDEHPHDAFVPEELETNKEGLERRNSNEKGGEICGQILSLISIIGACFLVFYFYKYVFVVIGRIIH